MSSNNLHHHQSPPQHHPITNDSEVVRRPRGRPPGTKNKPKSSLDSVTHKPNPCMSPYVLEVSGGSDIIASLRQFCNHRSTSLCVLSGSGTVSNVSLNVRIPSQALITVRVFQGCSDLLSISATVILSSSPISTNRDLPAKFMVSIANPEGQMFGGAVVGPLIASGTVYIVAATLNNPNYYRLPVEEDNHIKNSEYGYVPVPIEQSLGSGGKHHHAVEPLILSMYGGCHIPADLGYLPTSPPHSSHD